MKQHATKGSSSVASEKPWLPFDHERLEIPWERPFDMQEQHLDFNHNFFLLVDDGSMGFGGEIALRFKLERYLASLKQACPKVAACWSPARRRGPARPG